LSSKKCDVTLLYANRNEENIALRKEVETITTQCNFKLIHILSRDEKFIGEKGHLDRERILRLVPDAKDREVFLCCPGPMMDAVRRALKDLGVSSDRIYNEQFAL